MARLSPPKWTLAAVGLLICWPAAAQSPPPLLPVAPNEILQVRLQPTLPPTTDTPAQPAPIQQPPPVQAPPPVESAPAPAPAAAAGGASTNIQLTPPGGGATAASAAAQNSPDLGQFLNRSEQSAGVEVQRRNAIISDARIRGLRNGQFLTLGDGAPFFPARLDLDTPVSKFNPNFLKSVNVIKGPYTTLLGPGFGFLDIATNDSPRLRPNQPDQQRYGGTSSLTYSTNGRQYNGLQTAYVADERYGARISYNILQGNDYLDGDQNRIPASYLSHTFNAAVGFDYNPDVTVEVKALRSFADDIEFPGLFFDIGRLDTEAYSTRLVLRNVGPYDQIITDFWYNGTAGTGNTRRTAKQFFVSNLLTEAFAEGRITPGQRVGRPGVSGRFAPFTFQDDSTSTFAERSIGARTAAVWENGADELTITSGLDINVFGQELVENVRFRQTGGFNALNPAAVNAAGLGVNSIRSDPNFGLPITPDTPMSFLLDQGIPKSNAINPGLFVEAMAPVAHRFTIKTGGRFDHVHASSNRRRISGNVDLFNDVPEVSGGVGFGNGERFAFDPIIYSTNRANNDLSRDFFLLAGFMTGEFELSKDTILFVGYGYAERAPTLTELYAAGPFIGVLQQGTSRLIGDPNLDKERLNQIDIGLKYNGSNLRAGVGGFYSLINDYITYDANKLSATGLTQVVYTNTSLATLAGTEAFVVANVGRYFSPFATLSYVQGFDQTHADRRRPADLASSRRNDPATRAFASQTEPLPQIPPMETRLGLRLHSPLNSLAEQPTWQLEASARVVNGQNQVAASLGEIVTPGFTTVDIRGFWQVNKYVLLTMAVENVGDLLYREHLDPVASTRFRALTGIPVAPLFRPGTNFVFSSQVTY